MSDSPRRSGRRAPQSPRSEWSGADDWAQFDDRPARGRGRMAAPHERLARRQAQQADSPVEEPAGDSYWGRRSGAFEGRRAGSVDPYAAIGARRSGADRRAGERVSDGDDGGRYAKMSRTEYKTVAMPHMVRTRRKRGQSRGEMIAETLSRVINEQSQAGWRYVGADHFRTMERLSIFRGAEEVVYTVLVFERPLGEWREDAALDHGREPEPRAHEPAPRMREPEPRNREAAARTREPEPRMREPEPRMREPEPRMRSAEPRVREPDPRGREPRGREFDPRGREPEPRDRDQDPRLRDRELRGREAEPRPRAGGRRDQAEPDGPQRRRPGDYVRRRPGGEDR
ncbi:MAG: hypothetical protein MRY74_08745 [Neomegalonema sp.]|nr:hypothetical protein [Neomegalonema sp.]